MGPVDMVDDVLSRIDVPCFAVPGNCDPKEILDTLEHSDAVCLHGAQINLGSMTIVGLGGSNPTPFNTPGEYTEDELARRLEPFASLGPLILICHTPPKGTKLDRAGEGKHFGSTAIREFIDRHQPRYFYCGHIHEAAGVHDVIGRTQCWNVGPRGQLLDLDALPK